MFEVLSSVIGWVVFEDGLCSLSAVVVAQLTQIHYFVFLIFFMR